MRKCRSWISICLVLALLLTASVGSASADQFAAAASSAVSGDACVQKAETAGEIDPFTSRKASNWCVCGTVNGSNWDKELPMTEVGDNVFAVSLYMRTGDELKVRQRGIWDTNIGAFGVSQGASLVAQESGKYTVRLSFPDEAEVELIPEWKNSRWSVIGTVNGTGWDTDFPMEEGSGGVYTLEMDLFAGEELKVRRDRSWDVNIGAGGALNGDNVVVTETGRYTIRLSVRDGSAASLELIPVASTVQASSGWSVVGTLNGTNWKKDYPMHDLGYGRFESDPLQLRAGDELKVRKDKSWNVSYGLDGFQDGESIRVTESGEYYMLLAFHEGYSAPSVELLPVNFSGLAGKIREVKAKLEREYPVRIYIDPDQPYSSGYDCISNPEPIIVLRMLMDMETFFDALPPGFMTELHDGVPAVPEPEGSRIIPGGKIRIFLVQEIVGATAALTSMDKMTVCFGAWEYERGTLYHEFMHVMDARILTTLAAQGRNWDKEWAALSPAQAYDPNYSNKSVISQYFVSDYAHTEVSEDKAETFMFLCESSEPLSKASWYKVHPKIQAKVTFLIQTIREVFPSVQAVERAFWEKR